MYNLPATHLHRSVPCALRDDSGLRWDPHVLHGAGPGTVAQCRRPRRLGHLPYMERSVRKAQLSTLVSLTHTHNYFNQK